MCIKQLQGSGNIQMFIRCFCNNKVYRSLKSYNAHTRTQGHTIYKKLIEISMKVEHLKTSQQNFYKSISLKNPDFKP